MRPSTLVLNTYRVLCRRKGRGGGNEIEGRVASRPRRVGDGQGDEGPGGGRGSIPARTRVVVIPVTGIPRVYSPSLNRPAHTPLPPFPRPLLTSYTIITHALTNATLPPPPQPPRVLGLCRPVKSSPAGRRRRAPEDNKSLSRDTRTQYIIIILR